MNTSTLKAIGCIVAIAVLSGASACAQQETSSANAQSKVVTFYSDHVACYGRIFYPADFSADGKSPAVVLAAGWTGTAASIEKYAAKFAERGFVAMAIDYRGWGKSGGFVTQAERVVTDDRMRFIPLTTKVRIKRTRLLPEAQIEDIRNAISYLQGEPGVDRNRIGLWGTGFAGGHVISVASRDARVQVGVCQVPLIAGKDAPEQAFTLTGESLRDAIRRARTGQGETVQSGFGGDAVTIDTETLQAASEYLPFRDLVAVGTELPILFVTAENDEFVSNGDHAEAAAKALESQGNTVKVIEIPGITHFQVYEGKSFDTGSAAASEWFVEHL